MSIFKEPQNFITTSALLSLKHLGDITDKKLGLLLAKSLDKDFYNPEDIVGVIRDKIVRHNSSNVIMVSYLANILKYNYLYVGIVQDVPVSFLTDSSSVEATVDYLKINLYIGNHSCVDVSIDHPGKNIIFTLVDYEEDQHKLVWLTKNEGIYSPGWLRIK